MVFPYFSPCPRGKKTSDGKYNFIFKMDDTEHRFHRKSIGSAARGAAVLVVKALGKNAVGETVSIRRAGTRATCQYKIVSFEKVKRKIAGNTVTNISVRVRSLAKKEGFAAAKQKAIDGGRMEFTYKGTTYERVMSKNGNPTGLFRSSSGGARKSSVGKKKTARKSSAGKKKTARKSSGRKKSTFAIAKKKAIDDGKMKFTHNGKTYERVMSKNGTPTGLFRSSSGGARKSSGGKQASYAKTRQKMAAKRRASAGRMPMMFQ